MTDYLNNSYQASEVAGTKQLSELIEVKCEVPTRCKLDFFYSDEFKLQSKGGLLLLILSSFYPECAGGGSC